MRYQQENRGIKAVIYRELGRMVSRPIYFVMTLVIPLICYTFFTTLLNKGLPDKMPVAIVDLDGTSTSRLLTRQIDATQQSEVVIKCNSYNEALLEMQKGNIYAFIVIPADFQADIMSQRQPEVAFYVENAHFIAGALLMKDLNLTIASVAGGVNLKTRLAKGQTPEYAMAQINPIKVDISEMGNAWTNYSVYLNTTMLPGILQLMILIVTVFSIGSELKDKTSREWLIIADKSILKALIGKLLPYTCIFILLAFFGNVILFKFLKFPFLGSEWQMALGVVLFVLAQQALGIVLFAAVPVLRDALSLTAILGTMAISFSGLTFPVEGMYDILHSWNILFPLRHYFLIYSSQALTGAGMAVSWGSYLSLLLFILAPSMLVLRLKKALIYQNFPTD